ncbi:hypothetical protein ACU4GD_02055 [Cupriavidus basilensis]
MLAGYVRRRVRIAGAAGRRAGMVSGQQRIPAGIKARLSLDRSTGGIVIGSGRAEKSRNTPPPRYSPDAPGNGCEYRLGNLSTSTLSRQPSPSHHEAWNLISNLLAIPCASTSGQWRWATGKPRWNYDDWLSRILDSLAPDLPGHAISRVIREGRTEFRLEHRARYEVRHPDIGVRRFVCAIDSDATLIAFEHTVSGVRYPWVTISGVFTQIELRTLQVPVRRTRPVRSPGRRGTPLNRWQFQRPM